MIISGKARCAAVIGWPVSHSKSPRLHGYWLDHYEIDGVLVPLAVAPQHFNAVLRQISKMGFVGACVTLPHKQAALAAVDQVDETAKSIGAVNTIIINPDGGLYGQNTDGYGFIENLKQHAPEWHPQKGAAVVLGAGGAARAVLYALSQSGVPEIRLVNRTRSKAQELADVLSSNLTSTLHVHDWEEREVILAGAKLLVNTTLLGMDGQASLDLSLETLDREALVTDIVYTPLMTPLLKSAQARGNMVVDGLGMLIHQARPGFKAWFGREPEVTDDVRNFLLLEK